MLNKFISWYHTWAVKCDELRFNEGYQWATNEWSIRNTKYANKNLDQHGCDAYAIFTIENRIKSIRDPQDYDKFYEGVHKFLMERDGQHLYKYLSASIPDLVRERPNPGEWNPGKALLKSIRDYQSATNAVAHKWAVISHHFWSAVSGADVPLNSRIGGGLLLPHPNGVVVHPDAQIGANCLLFQQVTIGTGGPIPGVPILGCHVDVGAGAKILGGVRIGNHVKIGANAVVIDHVPNGCTAIGIPARIIRMREEK
jgi:serine O-acetyltransferase